MNRSNEERLDALFGAYRAACPDPEPGVNFMPQLWERIEGRRNFSFAFRRMARGLVTAAVAAALAMAVYLYYPQTNSAFYSETYVEALAAGHGAEIEAAVDLDGSEMAGQL